MWAVAATRGLYVPLAFFVLVLDSLAVAGHFLLGGGGLRGCERVGVGRERLGERAVDLVGPTAIVLDDLVGDFGHRGTFRSRHHRSFGNSLHHLHPYAAVAAERSRRLTASLALFLSFS